MDIKRAQHISRIPYISNAYGQLLAYERGNTRRDYHNVNRVHLNITVDIHNKVVVQTKYKQMYA
jgi:hypothetical protein